jgi:hypothetical protein
MQLANAGAVIRSAISEYGSVFSFRGTFQCGVAGLKADNYSVMLGFPVIFSYGVDDADAKALRQDS